MAQKSARVAHLAYLDSARGLAALAVLCSHFAGWKYPTAIATKLSLFAFNGTDSVSFFFVLSGMVLSYKYLTLGHSLDYKNYGINRFFRLFPGYFIALLVNALYWHRGDLSLHALSDMLIKNKDGFWEEAVMIRNHNQYFMPGWTLIIEFAASLMLPFAMAIFRFNPRMIPLLMLACLITGSTVVNIVMLHFLAGLLIAGHFRYIQSESFEQTKVYRYRYWILAAAVVLFSLRRIDAISEIGPSLKYLLSYLNFEFFLFSGLAAAIFLVWILHSRRAQQVLSNPVLHFLGRISYGVYLMHWLVVAFIFDQWEQIMLFFNNNIPLALAVMFVVALTATILLATVLYYFIELPTIRLGKRWTARMRPNVIIPELEVPVKHVAD